MKFNPLTPSEIATLGLWPDGIYSFLVEEAQSTLSKASGNEMIRMKVRIVNDAGSSKTLFDYLMPEMAYKLVHFCEATNQFHKYEAGDLQPTDCLGQRGLCKVGTKPADGQYQASNAIKDYILPDDMATLKAARKAADASIDEPSTGAHAGLNDDIPF